MIQFEAMKSWIEDETGGWVSRKLVVKDYLSERGRYDRRLEVLEDVAKDEVLVKLPLSRVLSSSRCQQDQSDDIIQKVVAAFEAQKSAAQPIDISPWAWIALYMVANAHKSEHTDLLARWHLESFLREDYVDAALSYIPLFWDDTSLLWLNGTDFLNVHMLDTHAVIESEYQKLGYLASLVTSSVPLIEFKKWAMVVMLHGETVNLPDQADSSKMVPQLAIMPFTDLVDHHLPMPEQQLSLNDDLHRYQELGSRTNISYSSELAAVVLTAREVLSANTAVTSGYGVHSNADYLLYHGFTMPQDWSDLTVCIQYAMIELPLPTEMPAWKSRFLVHPYRFAVPACPSRKSTPHILIGAARFLVATEQDVLGFEERLFEDPGLLESNLTAKEEKFLHHSAKEALVVACDTKAAPPICRSVLSARNEAAAWDLVKMHTLARVAQHTVPISEDDRLLREDDAASNLSVNERHAVIVRREEKLTLRRWCMTAVQMANFLSTPEGKEECCNMVRLPDTEELENEEPRLRPRYWSRLHNTMHEADVPVVCEPR
jgi:hypothetical protein